MENIVDRFFRYIKIDTTSDDSSHTYPSTARQWDLAHLLYEELKHLGLQDVTLDEHANVMGTLPSNVENKDIPVIGFLAHMDTSADVSGTNVNPQIIQNYDGGDIQLNRELSIVLSPATFPELKEYAGQTLITTDGTTLLGADDKAGIAEIMCAIETLLEHPDKQHGTIKVAFTPDEEIGRGTDFFDIKRFGADFAYTLDGGKAGELEYENFNAAQARITIQGRNVHPGTSKNKMVNSIHLATELNDLLPISQRPEYTEAYEGFFHLIHFDGTVEKTTMVYIIRDHDKTKFENKKQFIQQAVDFLNMKYSGAKIILELRDQYYNMREKILPVMHIITTAKEAILQAGLEPVIIPVRGGTDGARLSYQGLPTPNLFTGGHNAHGKYEFIPVQSMEKAAEVILNIIRLYTQAPDR